MEAAEDAEFLDAMQAAHIKGALVGVEAVTPAGLKDVYKEFNCAGDDLVKQLRTFRQHGVYILGSFIFGLPSDRPETFDATALAAVQAEMAFAQFVTLTPYPGTVDFIRWEKQMEAAPVHGCRHTDYPPLAYSASAAAQAVLAPPHHVGRGNSPAHAIRLGHVLRSEVHLDAVPLHKIACAPAWRLY